MYPDIIFKWTSELYDAYINAVIIEKLLSFPKSRPVSLTETISSPATIVIDMNNSIAAVSSKPLPKNINVTNFHVVLNNGTEFIDVVVLITYSLLTLNLTLLLIMTINLLLNNL